MKSLKETIMESNIPTDKSKQVDVWDRCVDLLGEKEMLDALFQAMSSDEVKDMLEYFDRMYDLDIMEDDEEDDD